MVLRHPQQYLCQNKRALTSSSGRCSPSSDGAGAPETPLPPRSFHRAEGIRRPCALHLSKTPDVVSLFRYATRPAMMHGTHTHTHTHTGTSTTSELGKSCGAPSLRYRKCMRTAVTSQKCNGVRCMDLHHDDNANMEATPSTPTQRCAQQEAKRTSGGRTSNVWVGGQSNQIDPVAETSAFDQHIPGQNALRVKNHARLPTRYHCCTDDFIAVDVSGCGDTQHPPINPGCGPPHNLGGHRDQNIIHIYIDIGSATSTVAHVHTCPAVEDYRLPLRQQLISRTIASKCCCIDNTHS